MARYGSLSGLEAKLNKEASRYHLRAITPEGLRAAIERPAEQAGLEWEGDLPERIVEDAASSKGSLPLVAHVLWALNEDRGRRGGRRLLVEAYRKLGGVGGALAKSADALLESLGEAGRERAKRLLFVIDRKLRVIAGAGPVQKELLERVSKLQERLLEGASESAYVLQSRSAVHMQRGDVALTHDDLALARKEYEAALAIARKLLEADPSNVDLKRNLSVSYIKVGDVAQAGGDLSGARRFSEKGFELIQTLSEADPSNAGLKRDLSVSYTRLGAVAQAGADHSGARGFFEKGLEVIKALSEADPSPDEVGRLPRCPARMPGLSTRPVANTRRSRNLRHALKIGRLPPEERQGPKFRVRPR